MEKKSEKKLAKMNAELMKYRKKCEQLACLTNKDLTTVMAPVEEEVQDVLQSTFGPGMSHRQAADSRHLCKSMGPMEFQKLKNTIRDSH